MRVRVRVKGWRCAAWGRGVPRCGGYLPGTHLPHLITGGVRGRGKGKGTVRVRF